MMYSNLKDVLQRVAETTEFLGMDLNDVNQKGIFGNTPLSVTVSWNDCDAVQLLLEAGARVNERIEDGETALHRAVTSDQIEIVKLLLSNGADVRVTNSDGMTPLQLANSLGLRSVAALLIQLP